MEPGREHVRGGALWSQVDKPVVVENGLPVGPTMGLGPISAYAPLIHRFKTETKSRPQKKKKTEIKWIVNTDY